MRVNFALPCVAMEKSKSQVGGSEGCTLYFWIRLYCALLMFRNKTPFRCLKLKTRLTYTEASAEHNAAAARITKSTRQKQIEENRTKTVFFTATITAFRKKKRSITETEQFP
jgi:hypothetical protein